MKLSQLAPVAAAALTLAFSAQARAQEGQGNFQDFAARKRAEEADKQNSYALTDADKALLRKARAFGVAAKAVGDKAIDDAEKQNGIADPSAFEAAVKSMFDKMGDGFSDVIYKASEGATIGENDFSADELAILRKYAEASNSKDTMLLVEQDVKMSGINTENLVLSAVKAQQGDLDKQAGITDRKQFKADMRTLYNNIGEDRMEREIEALGPQPAATPTSTPQPQ
jgi:hypothetical protein